MLRHRLERQGSVEMASKFAGVSATIKQDPSKLRPSDVPLLLGDCTKAKKALGYEPTIPFEQTIKDMLSWQDQLIKGQHTA